MGVWVAGYSGLTGTGYHAHDPGEVVQDTAATIGLVTSAYNDVDIELSGPGPYQVSVDFLLDYDQGRDGGSGDQMTWDSWVGDDYDDWVTEHIEAYGAHPSGSTYRLQYGFVVEVGVPPRRLAWNLFGINGAASFSGTVTITEPPPATGTGWRLSGSIGWETITTPPE